MSKNSIVLNFFAGPGACKSAFCAGVFSKLKFLEISTEMALEFAKDLVWEESHFVLSNQLYVFGNQHVRISKLKGKVDVIVTDSPLLNSVIYDAKNDDVFKQLIIREHNKLNNLNYFLVRTEKYEQNGRIQTFEEAKEKDNQIKSMLLENNIPFKQINALENNINIVVDDIVNILKNKKDGK